MHVISYLCPQLVGFRWTVSLSRRKALEPHMMAPYVVQTQIKENIEAPRHWPFVGKSPVTGEFPAQRASNAENVSI